MSQASVPAGPSLVHGQGSPKTTRLQGPGILHPASTRADAGGYVKVCWAAN